MKARLLLFFGLLSLVTQAGDLTGRWNFRAILNSSGDSLFPIDRADTLKINTNGTFAYFLAAKDLTAAGSWTVTDSLLSFSYTLPADTVRHYVYTTAGDSQLTLDENGTRYIFERQTPEAAPLISTENKNDPTLIEKLTRGILGIFFLISIGYLFSKKRKKIQWKLVLKGLALQLVFAFGILKVEFIQKGFDKASQFVVTLLSFTRDGSEFLFGGLISDTSSFGYIFAFQVLPTVIFFSALTSLLFYFGILQKIVYAMAWVMKRTMNLSGAESLSAAGNIFLGQTESPLLVKPYLDRMTMSELLCVMTGGMATIAGGVLAAYIGFLGNGDPLQEVFFAKHLLAASVMSAPAAIVSAKLLWPETHRVDDHMQIDHGKIGGNALEAISNGTTDGLKLAVNVGAMLLAFIALMALFNYILEDGLGAVTGLNPYIADLTNGQYSGLNFQFILGYGLAPVTWLMGVPPEDILVVGQLLGEKTILNEFVAYVSLDQLRDAGSFTNERSIVIATYILCGFANFASIGIQIGGIGALAPSRRSDLSRLGMRALLAGTMASLFTAVIVGMMI